MRNVRILELKYLDDRYSVFLYAKTGIALKLTQGSDRSYTPDIEVHRVIDGSQTIANQDKRCPVMWMT